jgi:hypothetical protein
LFIAQRHEPFVLAAPRQHFAIFCLLKTRQQESEPIFPTFTFTQEVGVRFIEAYLGIDGDGSLWIIAIFSMIMSLVVLIGLFLSINRDPGGKPPTD